MVNIRFLIHKTRSSLQGLAREYSFHQRMTFRQETRNTNPLNNSFSSIDERSVVFGNGSVISYICLNSQQ